MDWLHRNRPTHRVADWTALSLLESSFHRRISTSRQIPTDSFSPNFIHSLLHLCSFPSCVCALPLVCTTSSTQHAKRDNGWRYFQRAGHCYCKRSRRWLSAPARAREPCACIVISLHVRTDSREFLVRNTPAVTHIFIQVNV